MYLELLIQLAMLVMLIKQLQSNCCYCNYKVITTTAVAFHFGHYLTLPKTAITYYVVPYKPLLYICCAVKELKYIL